MSALPGFPVTVESTVGRTAQQQCELPNLFGVNDSTYTAIMLRRLATLGVLLLSLSGVAPAALACALLSQGVDCCPEGQPCEPASAPAIVASTRAPCCAAQPAPTRSVAAARFQAERRVDDVPAPDRSIAPGYEIPDTRFSPIEPTLAAAAPSLPLDQQQTYLRTGRLRL